MFRAESRIHGKHAHQAAAEETCPNQQNQGNRELTGDDRPADSLFAQSASLLFDAFGERLADVSRRGANRGEDAQARCQQNAQAQGK